MPLVKMVGTIVEILVKSLDHKVKVFTKTCIASPFNYTQYSF